MPSRTTAVEFVFHCPLDTSVAASSSYSYSNEVVVSKSGNVVKMLHLPCVSPLSGYHNTS